MKSLLLLLAEIITLVLAGIIGLIVFGLTITVGMEWLIGVFG